MNQTNNTSVQEQLKALEAAYKAAETAIKTKYPNLTIVDGSLVQEKDHPKFGSKRRVTVVCGCGAHVERATSDLHTFIGCPICKDVVRSGRKAQKQTNLLEEINRLKAELEASKSQG